MDDIDPHEAEGCKKIIDTILLKQKAFEYAGDGIILTGSLEDDCPIIYCNEAFALLTGYSEKAEILGKNCRFLQGEKTSPSVKKKISHALHSMKMFSGRVLNYRKNGTMFWNHLTITPVFNGTATAKNFIGIQRDVTHFHELEKKLKVSEKKNVAYKIAIQNFQKRVQTQEKDYKGI